MAQNRVLCAAAGGVIYGDLQQLIKAKRGAWTDREMDVASKRFGIDRAALAAAAVGKTAKPSRPSTMYERIAEAKRLRAEAVLIADGIPPSVAERLVSER